MVDLPRPDFGLVTAEAPRSSVSGDIFKTAPQQSIAPGLAALGEGVNALAVKAAENKATSDLRSATLGPDGLPQKPDDVLILGDAGKAYQHAIETGASTILKNTIGPALTDLHQQYPNDPQGFQIAYQNFADGLKAKYPGQIGLDAFDTASQMGMRHYASIVATKAAQGIENTKQGYLTAITDSERLLQQMALNGQEGTADFAKAMADVGGARAKLVDNPAFGYSSEKAASDAQISAQRIRILSVQGKIQGWRDRGEKTYDQIDAELERLRDDPKSTLSASENWQLYNAGVARLTATSQQQQAAAGAIRVTTDRFEHAFADPQAPKPTRDQIDELAQKAIKNGASDAYFRLKAMSDSYRTLSSMTGLTPAQKAQMIVGPQAMGANVGDRTFNPSSPDTYLDRTKSMENPSGDPTKRSPTGATGDFQFTNGTAAQYGLTDPTNPGASREAARRLAIDNAASLKSTLGRDPTEAEVYLAHQQGAAGAAALLQHPEMNAVQALATYAYKGDLAKADQAIRVNGGNPTMTAAQFAQKWTGRYNGATASPIPYTPQQIADNPIIASTYIQFAQRDAAKVAETGRAMGNAIVSAYEGGFKPSVPELAAFRQYAAQVPDQLGDLSRKVEMTAAAHEQARGVAPSAAGGASIITAADAYATANPSIGAAQAAGILRRQIDGEHQRFTTDPFAWSYNNGLSPHAPRSLDLANPNASAAELQSRAATLAHMPPAAGQSFSLLRPGELDAVKEMVANGTTDQKIGFLTSLARSGAPEPALKATLAQLGSDSATRSLAVASAVARDAPETAKNVLVGQALLKENPKLAPREAESATAYWKALPGSDFPVPAVRDAVMSASAAVYAKYSADANDVSGKLNQDRLTQAINDVTGGVLTFRGSKILAPWAKADDAKLDAALHSLTDQDMFGAITQDGQPFPAAALQTRRLGTSGAWRLQSYQDGRYLIYSGDGENRRFIQRNKFDARDPGGPFVLDLGSKRIGVETSSPRVAVGLTPPALEPIVAPGDLVPTKSTLPVSTEMGQAGKGIW